MLTVEFLGDRFQAGPGGHLTFGRDSHVTLDTNRELPPVAGCFVSLGPLWWVTNETAASDLVIADRSSRSRILATSGTRVPVGFANSLVRLEVGRARYEMGVSIADVSPFEESSVHQRPPVQLNHEQRLLLTALAESSLQGRRLELPSNTDTAERLGWRLTKLNRKLDHLCVKFDKLGVPGLRGTSNRLATARRQILVQHCLDTGIITVADLHLLVSSTPTDS